MSQPTETERQDRSARRALWAASGFYVLIAFEFFYMASPFATYFYAVYGPGLDWMQGWAGTSWAVRFFLPHLVEETRSPLIDVHEYLGVVLFFGGLAAFAVGAVQIYRAKLRRQDAVMGGLYRYIRHPQYLALITASIGMLLIWPRFLVLIGTITVIFIYMALAKAEEAICLRKYPTYADYLGKTGTFLPRSWIPRVPRLFGTGRLPAWLGWSLAYLATIAICVGAAFAIQRYTVASLFTYQSDSGVYLSVTEMSQADLAEVARLANPLRQSGRPLRGREGDAALLNYVLPREMYVSEIPMYLPEGRHFGHSVPHDVDPAAYKVIFTKADFGADDRAEGLAILRRAVNKYPLIEVWVDLTEGAVVATHPPPEVAVYGNRQVPLF